MDLKELLKKFYDAGIMAEATLEEKYSFEQTLADNSEALQLQQTGVIKSVCDCAKDEFCCRCHESKGWKIENGKYVKQTVL
jgi:hypothetical protein